MRKAPSTTGDHNGHLNGEDNEASLDDLEGLIPFDPSMERISVFIPRYLSRLMTMVAMKEDTVKAKVIRNAIVRELRRYVDKAETHNGGPYDAISNDSPMEVASDAEENGAFVKRLYRDFAVNDEKFPTRVRLRRFDNLRP